MKIVLSGGWSYGNIGDEVIAKCMIALIREHFAGIPLIVTSYDPADFKYHHGMDTMTSVHRELSNRGESNLANLEDMLQKPEKYGLKDYADLFDKDTVFIMGGGGYFIGAWDSMYLARLFEIGIAKQRGAKVFVLGQSIGPIEEARCDYARRAFRQCDYICVRDMASKKFIDSVMREETADLAADVAVIISEIVEQRKYTDGKKHLSFMLQNFTYHVSDDARKNPNPLWMKIKKRLFLTSYIYNRRVKKIIYEVAKRDDIHLDFVQSVQKTGAIPNAHFLAYVNGIVSKLPKEKYTIHSDMTVDEFCRCLSGGRATMSMKMHPLVVSSSYKVDTIAITQNYKIDDFMEALGRKEFCYKNVTICPDKIIAQINESFRRDTDHGVNQVERMQEEVRRMFRKVQEIVRGCE